MFLLCICRLLTWSISSRCLFLSLLLVSCSSLSSYRTTRLIVTVFILVEIEVYRCCMIKNEIIHAILPCSYVNIRPWMVNMHYIVNYSAILFLLLNLLLLLLLIVISIESVHVDIVSWLLVRYLLSWFLLVCRCRSIIQLRLVGISCYGVVLWLHSDFVAVDNESFDLVWQHGQAFVLASGLIHCGRGHHHYWSTCFIGWFMVFRGCLAWDEGFRPCSSKCGVWLCSDPLCLIHWVRNSLIIHHIVIICEAVSMPWWEHF